MNALLSDPMVLSIASGTLAILAGALGFMFRAIQTHSKPMARILSFSNESLNSKDTEEIKPESLTRLKTLKTVVPMHEKARWTLREISDELTTVRRWAKAAPDFKADVDHYTSLLDRVATPEGHYTDELITSIREIVSYFIIDGLLVATIGRGILRVPKPDASLEPTLSVRRSNDKQGCYFVFAPEPVSLGRGLNEDPAREHFYKDIATLIANAEHQKLRQIFLLLSEALQADLPLMKDLQRDFEAILESHTIYTAKIYFANLTTAPILIEPGGTLRIEGIKTTRGNLIAPVKYLTITTNDKGELQREVEDAVVVPPGGDIRLLAFTRPSREIGNGGILNAVFSEGSAHARMILRTESIGMIRRRNLTTPSVSFCAQNKKS